MYFVIIALVTAEACFSCSMLLYFFKSWTIV